MHATDLAVLPDAVDPIGPARTGPLHLQLALRLEQAIRDGRIPAGSRLEGEIALGERLHLSRMTVRRAIQALVEQGLIVRRRGIGTQVLGGPESRRVGLTSLRADLQRTGKHPTTTVVLHEVVGADATTSAALVVEPGSPVLHLRRIRAADGVAVALLDNVLPADLLEVSVRDLETRGLYELLEAHGVEIRVARQRVGAREATRPESRALGVPTGDPVLTVERTAFDSAGRAVESARHCYHPDRYAVATTLVAR